MLSEPPLCSTNDPQGHRQIECEWNGPTSTTQATRCWHCNNTHNERQMGDKKSSNVCKKNFRTCRCSTCCAKVYARHLCWKTAFNHRFFQYDELIVEMERSRTIQRKQIRRKERTWSSLTKSDSNYRQEQLNKMKQFGRNLYQNLQASSHTSIWSIWVNWRAFRIHHFVQLELCFKSRNCPHKSSRPEFRTIPTSQSTSLHFHNQLQLTHVKCDSKWQLCAAWICVSSAAWVSSFFLHFLSANTTLVPD